MLAYGVLYYLKLRLQGIVNELLRLLKMKGETSMNQKVGGLIVNLGTPRTSRVSDVRSYLREFLGDKRVIDIPWLFRFLLVNLIIAPFRAKKSAAMYQKVWLENGKSPLLHYSQLLADKLRRNLSGTIDVELAMRYGEPSIRSSLIKLRQKGVERIVVQPLFPQFALATYESATEKVKEEAKSLGFSELTFLDPYFNEAGFIDAESKKALKSIEVLKPDHILMSFHGLPVRHCRKTEVLAPGELSRCGTQSCCEKMTKRNEHCYRTQCFETARAIASKLGLAKSDYTVAFQSRFGRDPWIQPFTDKTLEELKESGKKKVLVLSPSFAADCLETLEEVGIGLKHDFESDYDGELIVEPCLNDDDNFVDFMTQRFTACVK